MTTSIRYTVWRTFLGDLFAAATDRGLCALHICHEGDMPRMLSDLRKKYPLGEPIEDANFLKPLRTKVEEVLAGTLPAERVPLDVEGTPFQKRVWQTLVQVPWGKTLSYSELARRAGNAKAIRAAASACARNPIVFVIPCHRVLSKDGSLGGYYWGLDMKQSLLARESPF